MVKKIIIGIIVAAVISLGSWVGNSIFTGMRELTVASTNIANCTKSLDKLADRFETMDSKFAELDKTIVELKVRLETLKLENMEASLSLAESVELLRDYTAKIRVSTGHKSIKDLPPKPTTEGPFKDYDHRIIEQRKLIERISP